MARPIHAMIDLMALRANVQRVRACAPTQQVIAVLKANAYGHGAVQVAQALAGLVEAFAVCSLEEALELRAAEVVEPIVLLEGFFEADELAIIAQQNIHIAVHSTQQLEILLKSPELAQSLNIWLKVDTGMRRLGFYPKDVATMWKHLQPQFASVRIMSHLACADERDSAATREQIKQFTTLMNALKVEGSLANSAGVLAWETAHVQWVRPGIMLYGASPFPNTVGNQEGLQPVMTLHSSLISVKTAKQGDSVGYGATFRCPQTMPIGVVAVGYADGYPRHAPTGTPVLVNGRRVPLIGRVSMDMITVDLRTQPNARAGDPVILWGRGLPIEEIAAHAQTIAYELLCNVAPRVPRVWRG